MMVLHYYYLHHFVVTGDQAEAEHRMLVNVEKEQRKHVTPQNIVFTGDEAATTWAGGRGEALRFAPTL